MERGGISLDRLERFEKALDDIINNYKILGEELEKLRNEGKSKTTKFRELLGKKLVYSMIITIFKRYDLIDKDKIYGVLLFPSFLSFSNSSPSIL